MKPATIPITQMGEFARACLGSGQRGKLLAVFSRAIYLLTDSNELLWIVTDDAPMHRRCARISSPLPACSPGSRFQVEDHYLIIDSVSAFELTNAAVWVEPRVYSKHILEITSLPKHIDSILSDLDLSQAQGFGTFLPNILALTQSKTLNSSSRSLDPILVAAGPLVFGMARACLAHQSAQISQIAEKLIGLGTGLTPSGDDFLGGVLFAVHMLQNAYPDQGFKQYRVAPESYRSKTHLISFTLLNDLANGHALEPFHQMINGLLTGKSPEHVRPFILELTRVGHSTGWDLLTGLLAGLITTYRSPKS